MYFFIITMVILIVVIDMLIKKDEKLTKAQKKGIQGEQKVSEILKSLPKSYVLINDLLIKYGEGTTQIDHIVICKKGIFVIETKNYSGKIYGDDYMKYWTQKLKGKKNTFYSPVWQNRTHVRAVKNVLKDFKEVPIYSVIVFCGECNIRKVKSGEAVIYLSKLKKHIKRFKSEFFINKKEISNITDILNSNNIHSKRIRSKHVRMIKKEYI